MELNKKILLIIFIIFIFYSKIHYILIHICKSLLYIVIGLFIINLFDSKLTLQIKEILIDIISMKFNYINNNNNNNNHNDNHSHNNNNDNDENDDNVNVV
jgi:hypothetical protein